MIMLHANFIKVSKFQACFQGGVAGTNFGGRGGWKKEKEEERWNNRPSV